MPTQLDSGARSGSQELAEAKAHIQQLEMELEGYRRRESAPSPRAVAKIKQLEDEVASLKNDIDHYELEQGVVAGELSEARQQVATLHKKNQTLRRQVDKFKAIGDESQTLRAQNQALGDEVDARDRTIEELTRKLNAAPKAPGASPLALAALQTENKALCDRIQVLEADLELIGWPILVKETTEYDLPAVNRRRWSRAALVAVATATLIFGCFFGLVAGTALNEHYSDSALAHAATPAASVLPAGAETKPSEAAAATEQSEAVQASALISSVVGAETPPVTPTSTPSSTGLAASSATPPPTAPLVTTPAPAPAEESPLGNELPTDSVGVILPTVTPTPEPAVPLAAANQVFQHNAIGESMMGNGQIEKVGAGGDIQLVAHAGEQVIVVRLLRPAYPAGDPPLVVGQVVRFRGTIVETGAGQEVHVTLSDAVIEPAIAPDVQNAPSPSE